MEQSVHVDGYPSDLVFPPEYAGKIRYDGFTKRLCYTGFMSKADYDRLYQAHESWVYRRALESLFRICTTEQVRSSQRLGLGRVFAWLRNTRRPLGST